MTGENRDPRKEFGKAVTELAQYDEDIVVLSADSGNSSGFGKFSELFPERYFEFGIMEQAVTGIASGLATTGKKPVFCAIAPFVTARSYEMFKNDLGYMKQNVKIVGRNGGMTYSDLGPTHHSLEDYAIIRMIPGVVILAPQDPVEIKNAVKAMLDHKGPVYMRIGNAPIPILFKEKPFKIGKGSVLKEGTDLTVVSTGTITNSVLKAAEFLEKKGLSMRIVGMPTVWPVDEELLIASARKTGKVLTVEEHYVSGGLGSAVAEVLSEHYPVPVKRVGIPNIFVSSGPYDQLLKQYHLDSEGIAASIEKFLNKS